MSELDLIANCGVSLYPYQTKALDDFCTARDFMRRILIVAPTGSGKTVIGSAIMKIYADLFCPVLVLAHRREIIAQTHKKLADHSVNAGIILAGHPVHPMRLVQVASLQTLHARTRREVMQLPPAKLVVIDEAHHALAQTYRMALACAGASRLHCWRNLICSLEVHCPALTLSHPNLGTRRRPWPAHPCATHSLAT
jgi:superfamily II DNA or RNA helicase